MQIVETDIKQNIASTSRNQMSIVPFSGATRIEKTASQLKAEDELRTALFDSIAHDLRSSLTVIRMALEIPTYQSRPTSQQWEEMTAVVEDESHRLNRLIGQTIRVAQLGPRAARVNAQPQDLHDLVREVLQETRSWLHQHKVTIRISESLPLVSMDCELISRVLRHLLENAAVYSPRGSEIEVSGRIEGDRLLVTVADEGPGIDVADAPFIFERSFRGRSHPLQTQGTGMGLAITQVILDAHGGGIRVVNSPGHGAAFTFWIPA
jgi:two-component system sensor histidine kinase KdpD